MNRKSKPIDPAFTSVRNTPGDIDEVAYMTLFGASSQSKVRRNKSRQQPLIDLVTPQPKSFYARVQSPASDHAKRSGVARIRRLRHTTGDSAS